MECHRLIDTIHERLAGPIPSSPGIERGQGLRHAAALIPEMSHELYQKLTQINEYL
jgi:hypothetical protein